MPTTINKTVNPAGGGDYTSLAALAAENRDLVSNDEKWIVECTTSSSTHDTGGNADFTTGNGWVTDATRFLTIQSTGAHRHTGTWDSAKYIFEANKEQATAIFCDGTKVVILGIQIQIVVDPATTGTHGNIAIFFNTDGCKVAYCLFTFSDDDGTGVTANAGGGSAYVYNNLFAIDSGTITATCISVSGVTYIENNTLISKNGSATGGIITTDSNPIARNNLVYGFGNSNSYIGTFASGTDYNTTDSTDSIGAGSNNRTGQTFTFTNAGSGDYSLAAADAGAKGFATTGVSGGFTDDIIGTNRNSFTPWDCGCFENTAVVGGVFRQSPMDGIGSGGPFFANPLG